MGSRGGTALGLDKIAIDGSGMTGEVSMERGFWDDFNSDNEEYTTRPAYPFATICYLYSRLAELRRLLYQKDQITLL